MRCKVDLRKKESLDMSLKSLNKQSKFLMYFITPNLFITTEVFVYIYSQILQEWIRTYTLYKCKFYNEIYLYFVEVSNIHLCSYINVKHKTWKCKIV